MSSSKKPLSSRPAPKGLWKYHCPDGEEKWYTTEIGSRFGQRGVSGRHGTRIRCHQPKFGDLTGANDLGVTVSSSWRNSRDEDRPGSAEACVALSQTGIDLL